MKLVLDNEGVQRALTLRQFYEDDHIKLLVADYKAGLVADFWGATTDEQRRSVQAKGLAIDEFFAKMKAAVDELTALEQQELKKRAK
jgi:hypothetical protein